MSWDNVAKYCLDYDTFGSEELIDDSNWRDEDLLSEEEIKRNKDRIREATSAQNLFKFLPSSSSQPVNPSSTRIKFARKNSNVKSRRKSLEGLHETIPAGASIIKTSDSTVTIRVPGRPDTDIHKADLAKFGTPEQRNTPLEQFIQPVDKSGNAIDAMVERMQKHVSTSLKKMSGEISIKKQSETDPSRDPSKSNTKKAIRIKIPERKVSRTSKRRSSKRKSSKEFPTNKQVRIASPDNSVSSYHSAPPVRIIRQETGFRRSKRLRKTTSRFGELASDTEIDDEIVVQGPSCSASSFQPAQLPDNRQMIKSSIQQCPQEDSDSDSNFDEYEEYEVDISDHELGHKDL